jgi:ribonuclease-3
LIAASRAESLALFEQRLGHRFAGRDRLDRALTHRSYSAEAADSTGDYETLEFLGDAVLGLILAAHLFERYPGYNEGQLSQMRSRLVNARSLAGLARHIGLGDLLLLGRGEEKSGGRQKDSLLAAGLEAILGAVYLDAGLHRAKAVFLGCFAKAIEGHLTSTQDQDHKGLLQQTALGLFGCVPTYQTVREEGSPHRKTFHVRLSVASEYDCIGTGRSKKDAGQDAARQLLRLLRQRGAEN